MSGVDVEAVLAGLKRFQRATVEHVIDRFYGAGAVGGSGRFLVADETGLGKSIVARGVIARAIEQLQRDDSVDRIDVVYVCSNADLAQQNLRRLNVTGEEHIGMATRLTMLAKESRRLAEPSALGGKKVNLVSFTPGTSFKDGGWRTGSSSERAMLTVILDRLVNESKSDRRSTRLLMQASVGTLERFSRIVDQLESDLREPDPRIMAAFHRLIASDGTLDAFLELREEARGKTKRSDQLRHRSANLTARLRQSLAKAGVDTLEPDLIILDEFQRFRHLLDPESGDAAELAHALFDHPAAKVLLLSATPYKPFTNSDDADDDHYRDFLATVRFLAGGDADAVARVAKSLDAYRRALVAGGDAADAALRVREQLSPLMARSERPPVAEREDLVTVRHLATAVPSTDDIRGWAALRRLGEAAGAAVDVEYWKSIPYFANFMDGYLLARRVDAGLARADAAVADALAGARTLDRAALESFDPVDLGNGHLRALAEQTVGAGWWKLLWVPPTLPYLEPGPVYREFGDGGVTKQVIFSAWSGVPTAVAALLSYEADRRAAGERRVLTANTPEARKAVRARLLYPLDEGRPAAMSTLALFWPHPALAALGDPLAAARQAGAMVSAEHLTQQLDARLAGAPGAAQAWEASFATPGALPAGLADASPQDLAAGGDEEDGSAGLIEHIRLARATASVVPHTHPELASLAAHAPGNIAWRALHGIAGEGATKEGLWRAAFELADGIRTLFNRTESIALLTTLYGDEPNYWQSVLAYCADGNLQAVLDEYLYQLWSETGGAELDDAGLLEVARRAAGAMSLRPARYEARDTSPERAEIPLMARFALRYGGKYATDADEQSGVRQSEVRAAFNSPFAPFVLASTSVGQEGIDFHWWSHSVIHWNLPSNPVDFEQREGRVNRYAGHAVRKNVGERHWDDVLASGDVRAWRAAFDAASRDAASEFSPWWVYPGSARIHRVLAAYPLSRDIDRYERLRSALTLYRLTLGQPRQEDMIEMLARRDIVDGELPTIDLRPPDTRRTL